MSSGDKHEHNSKNEQENEQEHDEEISQETDIETDGESDDELEEKLDGESDEKLDSTSHEKLDSESDEVSNQIDLDEGKNNTKESFEQIKKWLETSSKSNLDKVKKIISKKENNGQNSQKKNNNSGVTKIDLCSKDSKGEWECKDLKDNTKTNINVCELLDCKNKIGGKREKKSTKKKRNKKRKSKKNRFA